MSRTALKFAAVLAMTVLGGTFALAAEEGQAELLKALGGAKHTLLQGIAQVAKGTKCPRAKYEMDHGKLMLTVYTSAKGFDTAAEDNSFNDTAATPRQHPGRRAKRSSPTSSTSLGRRNTIRCYRRPR